LLSQVYPEYVNTLSKYQATLSRCNALLRHLRDHNGDKAQLAPLEADLARTGVMLSLYRRRALAALCIHADHFHQELTGGKAWLQLQYQPNFDPLAPPALDYQLGLLPQDESDLPVDEEALKTAYHEMLLRTRAKAILRGAALIGPHRDEVRFLSEGVDLGTFGSRGQQRTAVLALRLAELHWLRQATGTAPVLLLDEVLAELDRERRHYLLGLLDGVEQSILATTDAEMFPDAFRKKTLTLEVREGIITPAD
jgi:DNA replication and repair protein RecF